MESSEDAGVSTPGTFSKGTLELCSVSELSSDNEPR